MDSLVAFADDVIVEERLKEEVKKNWGRWRVEEMVFEEVQNMKSSKSSEYTYL